MMVFELGASLGCSTIYLLTALYYGMTINGHGMLHSFIDFKNAAMRHLRNCLRTHRNGKTSWELV